LKAIGIVIDIRISNPIGDFRRTSESTLALISIT